MQVNTSGLQVNCICVKFKAFYNLRELASGLANLFGHPSQVHTQVLVLQTCIDLRVRLARALDREFSYRNWFSCFVTVRMAFTIIIYMYQQCIYIYIYVFYNYSGRRLQVLKCWRFFCFVFSSCRANDWFVASAWSY